uniref:Uncharacterized protein n=1 Tax=Meloidogyne enterolobii TaxID=390850 RepID=A0A6V7W5Y4_MELEN|nr:unnamed protein product [Meloidogyne enterolobii]
MKLPCMKQKKEQNHGSRHSTLFEFEENEQKIILYVETTQILQLVVQYY